ncbi:MAG: pantoate--beta-alanine ligase [Halofilum sp. (in: g-proteobacteria)]|nr:pantoate--beta-alanine ligase [Halofilum sp. (in: g-proteobacteria)]
MSIVSPALNRPLREASPAVVSDPGALREQVRAWRAAGERVALVPTMGDLHAGHLALVDAAAENVDRVVVSIFVNPLQFGPGEDYGEYPRTLERDCMRLAEHGAHAVFAPDEESLYPSGPAQSVRIRFPGLDDILCGAERPGHFTGVATVVAKLFNIAEPDVAVFGEKDYQQLLLVRRLASELDFAVEVIGVPTVREADGLAMSSRNSYLEDTERAVAPELHATLVRVAQRIAAGDRDHERLESQAMSALSEAGFEPGYVAVRRAADLGPPGSDEAASGLRVLAAARLGRARLIDNVAVSGS